MIPKTAEYALRTVIMLARAPDESHSAEEIAESVRVPRRHAHKVLQVLVRARLVRSQPGPGGGYSLVRPPEDVSILDVVSAVEPIPRIRRCPLGLKSHTSLCPLHRELDEAAAATERAFPRVTIAQLLNQPNSVPRCASCVESRRNALPIKRFFLDKNGRAAAGTRKTPMWHCEVGNRERLHVGPGPIGACVTSEPSMYKELQPC